MDRDCARIGCDVANIAPANGAVASYSYHRFHHDVFRKRFDLLWHNGGAASVELVAPLLHVRQHIGHTACIANEEVCSVEQHRSVWRLRIHLEPPRHTFRKALVHAGLLGGISGRAAEALVGLHQQHLGPAALKVDKCAGAALAHAADLPAVETEIV